MMMQSGKTRMEVVACLAAAHHSGDAAALSMFASVSEEADLVQATEEIAGIPAGERQDYIVNRLKSLVARDGFTGLSDIHPAWLVEVLSKESPRIIGIILRYLPSKQVRYIIEHLPKRIKHRLPQLIDAFAVPTPILEVIKERFERQFVSFRGSRDFDSFEFENITFLKSADLEALFRDLGIHELAMALKGVDRQSLNILFNRLSIDEARSLQQRIRSIVDMPASILNDAKYTVLEMSISETDSNNLLIDIGLDAFARTLAPQDMDMFPLIWQKLEPRLAYTLKRYIDQHAGSNTAGIIGRRKEIILGRVEALAKAGTIDENLARYFVVPAAPEVAEGAIDAANISASSSGDADSWQVDDGVV